MPQEHLFKQNAVPTAQPNPWVPADCGSLAKITVFGAVKSYLEKAHRVENAISQISLITQKSILASLREKRKHKVHGRFHNSGQSARCLYGRFTQVPKPAANLWGLGAP